MADPARRRLSFAEYLAAEQAGDVKHEWLDGQAVAMAGGTRVHALLQGRVITTLSNALSGRPCDVYGSDLMVRVPASGLATYPDATVVCGDFQGDDDHPEAGTNPVLLAEVLSPSTERWDRGGKFTHYQKLPSLRIYLLVNQDRQWVEWYERRDDGWHYHCAGPGDPVVLQALGVTLDVDTLYARSGVPVHPDPPILAREPEPSWPMLRDPALG